MTPKQYALIVYARLPPGLDRLAFIAGGCFRSLYDKTEVKDIDLFFASYLNFQLAVSWFEGDSRYTELPSDVSGSRIFTDGTNPPVNLVGFRFHKTLKDLVEDFDLTCVTCGAEMVEQGVVEIAQGNLFVHDATWKLLRFNKVQNYERAIRRLTRYESYGYSRLFSCVGSLVRARFVPAPARGGDY